MLKNDFVPVAIDQWYTRRQKDAEGEFYQAIARQGPRKDMDLTTQGLYVCDASGKLLGYNNNRHVGPIKAIMKKAIEDLEQKKISADRLNAGKIDAQYDRSIPQATVVVQVNSKILEGYKKVTDNSHAIFQRSIARDNLWILEQEKKELLQGNFPKSLARRIARFNLIDNTRGEPQMWANDEIKSLEMTLESDGEVTGTAIIKSQDGKRGYEAAIVGKIETGGDEIKKFDLVAKGSCYGNGRYTKRGPEGLFTLAIAFRVADKNDRAYAVAPQGSKGWLGAYIKNP